MAAPFLATKILIPPAPPNLVERARLSERLEACLHPSCRLALVCGPAGFGKTTLVSRWVEDRRTSQEKPLAVAWLSLDAEDNDPMGFWSCVIASLQRTYRQAGTKALTFLGTNPSPNFEQFITLLINDLIPIEAPLVLVLDDYHLIRRPEIHQSLSFLIEHAIANFHVLILSRTDPPLRLALLRSRSQLVEIRPADLRFSQSEAWVYLNESMKLGLSNGDVDSLNAKTEGWAAGLQMAAISMQGRQDLSAFVQNFSGSNRYILDFLSDEILDRQGEDIQRFLLRTSVLEKISAPLCEAVLDMEGSAQALIERLEKANLFLVPLDAERSWFRYHHLFAEILRSRLMHLEPELAPRLQKRAANWFESQGMIDESAHYLHVAKDHENMAKLLEQNALSLIRQGQSAMLRRWVQLLPEDNVQDQPWCCVLSAWAHAARADSIQATRWLDRAERLVQDRISDFESKELWGTIYALRTEVFHLQGDIPATIEMAKKALELLDPENTSSRASANYALGWASFASGELVWAERAGAQFMSMPMNVVKLRYYAIIAASRCSVIAIQGKLRLAIQVYQEAIEYMKANGGIDQFNLAGNVYQGLGMLYYEQNDLESANQFVEAGLQMNQAWGNMNAICAGPVDRAQLRITQGDRNGAEADLEEAHRIVQKYTLYGEVLAMVIDCHVRFYLTGENIPAARQIAEEYGLKAEAEINFRNEQRHIIYSRLLIAEGKYDEAENLLARQAEAARAGARFGNLIRLLNLRSINLQALGKSAEALKTLSESLSLAEPEGYVHAFVDEGRPMTSLLELAAQRKAHSEYVRFLLKAFHGSNEGRKEAEGPLSEREIQVLKLVAAGLANKEIAHKLYISVRTVKYHTAAIYEKLKVTGRAQAAVKAREMGLM